MLKVLLFLMFFSFMISSFAYASEISAIPEKETYGPNDWIKIFVDIDGYSGGVVSWTAVPPDGNIMNGSLTNIKASKATHNIIRNAFDNQFGNWKIEYVYNNIKKLIDVKIEPLTISATPDKLSYGPGDIATFHFSTNYYEPNSAKAQYLYVKIYDDKGNPAKLVEDITIKVSQPNIVGQFSIYNLLKHNPSGSYHAVANYYNIHVNVPFVASDTDSTVPIFLGSDKELYDPGNSVEINIVIPDISASSGILTVTSPSGKITTKTISVVSSLNRVTITGITSSEIGTYNVRFDYGENIATTTFDVLTESLDKPTLSDLGIEITLDKSQYAPGEKINAEITTSKSIESRIVYWFEDPSGNFDDQISFVNPVSGTFTIPHLLGVNSVSGQWKMYVKYGAVESSAIFTISGEPILQSETSSDVFIPDWIRNNALLWTQNQITDSDFATGLEFMIKEKIIFIPDLIHSNSSETVIPNWVKITARWWANELVSDKEFANSIKFLVNHGIIQI